MSFLIRISAFLGLFAAPRGFSQLVTSFFGAMYQGIHRYALCSLFFLGRLLAPFLSSFPARTYPRKEKTRSGLLKRPLRRIIFHTFQLKKNFQTAVLYFFFRINLSLSSQISFSLFSLCLSVLSLLCSCQSSIAPELYRSGMLFRASGGHKWTRTTDLTLIRRVL